MRKNLQNRAVMFTLTFVFALVISGAASAGPPGGWGPGWGTFQNDETVATMDTGTVATTWMELEPLQQPKMELEPLQLLRCRPTVVSKT